MTSHEIMVRRVTSLTALVPSNNLALLFTHFLLTQPFLDTGIWISELSICRRNWRLQAQVVKVYGWNTGGSIGFVLAGRGTRSSSATAYLHPALNSRSNLDVLMHAQVMKLKETSPLTFTAVEISQSADGSIGAAWILSLSGIGSKDELAILQGEGANDPSSGPRFANLSLRTDLPPLETPNSPMKPYNKLFEMLTLSSTLHLALHLPLTPFGDWAVARDGTDADREAYIRKNLITVVKGIKGVRVVDASIFPSIHECHPQGPVYTVGEKGAQLIKEDHGLA
ncbi:hypothetical protein K435DRAFT_797300 [Dendrothele bispora CBS 962.96]|uniref:Glucose-methanol-choline oxidoreductase C-terminal domain-containing protein n=1 Tax=Dendrothele bispora (strain CBS 962.96) TaxID=1314807 RepID=A0A4S8M2X6_DENBC|nr:hypothetical protein K435DRAFT_797300 [Dendrothele bispora CBS 962.96]